MKSIIKTVLSRACCLWWRCFFLEQSSLAVNVFGIRSTESDDEISEVVLFRATRISPYPYNTITIHHLPSTLYQNCQKSPSSPNKKKCNKTKRNVRSHGLAHASWDNVPVRSAMEYDAPLPPLTHRTQQKRAQDDVGREGEFLSNLSTRIHTTTRARSSPRGESARRSMLP